MIHDQFLSVIETVCKHNTDIWTGSATSSSATSVWLLGELSMKHDGAGSTQSLGNLLHPSPVLDTQPQCTNGKEDRSARASSHRTFSTVLSFVLCPEESTCFSSRKKTAMDNVV